MHLSSSLIKENVCYTYTNLTKVSTFQSARFIPDSNRYRGRLGGGEGIAAIDTHAYASGGDGAGSLHRMRQQISGHRLRSHAESARNARTGRQAGRYAAKAALCRGDSRGLRRQPARDSRHCRGKFNALR